ncbi:MAG: response regulator [Candidatus Latescibacter sp.]|nr:response regulator [Candidatus Latescibacter sp.]
MMFYVMIIDDDEDFASATATVLEHAGYEVRVESDIPGAEKSMKKRQPDLVILDVMFPENSSAGFTLARKMKHFEETFKQIPILMLTGVNSKFPFGFSTSDIDEKWLPVEDFLKKPVDFDILRNRVAALLPCQKY